MVFGVSAEVLWVFLVSMWRFKPDYLVKCVKRKKYMMPTFTIWTIALLLGITLYISLYV